MIEQTGYYSKDFKAINLNSLEEIEHRLRQGYLNRLAMRVKKLRKLTIERNWEQVRDECLALSTSGDSFGFKEVATLADQALKAIPSGKISRAATPTTAKKIVEGLITTIDSILVLQRNQTNFGV